MPGCELGDDDRPDVDYCYDPNWEETDPPSARRTPGPTPVPSSMSRTAGPAPGPIVAPAIVEEIDNAGIEQNEAMDDTSEAKQNDEVIDEDTNTDPDTKGFDVTQCGGPITKRAQECGGSRTSPETCCPGYVCEGKDSAKCVVNPGAGTPITASPTGMPSRFLVEPTPVPTRRPTESPTRLADKKPRTWNTLMPEYILRDTIKFEPRRIQRTIALERDAFKFTEVPSAAPSGTPSSRPSLRPSASPSGAPTTSPTYFPTIAPTPMRKDDCKIEMYYEKKFCWHDDASECRVVDFADHCFSYMYILLRRSLFLLFVYFASNSS